MLRAAGVCLGLPLLPSLGRWSRAADKPPEVPRRLAFLYIPNGVNVEAWSVTGSGENYELSPTLSPLARHRSEITVISGLNHENATPGPDGGGDHSRATAVYLTGVRPKKTGGSDIRGGISIDQTIAQRAGRDNRLLHLRSAPESRRW